MKEKIKSFLFWNCFSFVKTIIFYALLSLLLLYGVFFCKQEIFDKKMCSEDTIIFIPKKSSSRAIGKILSQKFDTSLYFFFLSSFLIKLCSSKKITLKSGEFLIKKNSSLWDIIHTLKNGRTIIYKLTIPEGLTVSEIIDKLNKISALRGNITCLPKEGSLLPETYQYQHHDTRESIIRKMEHAMQDFIRKNWFLRKCDVRIIRDENDLITLASIVEKETSLDHERPCVASVFFNRLKINMPLQADPTVVYALTNGKKILERPLTLNDLKINSPFNTYIKKGLPPYAIACPGKKALLSVLNPAETDFLYFVANGKNGHVFSENYKKHCKNVKDWYCLRKKIKK